MTELDKLKIEYSDKMRLLRNYSIQAAQLNAIMDQIGKEAEELNGKIEALEASPPEA